jgi:hypothetical protein
MTERNVTLECTSGVPKNVLSWYSGSCALNDKDECYPYTIYTGFGYSEGFQERFVAQCDRKTPGACKLDIHHVKLQDAGTYVCREENGTFIVRHQQFELTVISK